MAKLKENTIAKVCLVCAFSLIFTTAAFAGGLAAAFGQAGLYSSPFEDFQRDILISEAYTQEADFSSNAKITKKGELAFNHETEHEGYDFKVKYMGEIIYDETDKNEDYIVINSNPFWIEHPDKQDFDDYMEVTVCMKNNGTSKIASWQKNLKRVYDNKYVFIVVSAIGIIISVILFVLMMIGAGRREEDDEIHVRKIDRMPHDLYFLLAGSAITGLIALGVKVLAVDLETGILVSYLLGIICMFIFSAFAMSAAVQCKKNQMLKRTIIGRIILGVFRGLKKALYMLPVVWKVVGAAVILAVINLVIIAGGIHSEIPVVWAVFSGIFFVAAVWYLSMGFNKLKKAGDNVAAGNTDYRVDTAKMLPSMKQHGENINSINEAVTRAVDEQMKSERFKTELITNVSHDIKTPLTSIINYTDLLMAEDIDNETAREYIGIIAKHAARLKKLTVDVVDASKASTGNIKVDLVKFSIGMMAEQVVGEYREKLEERGLKPVLNIPEEELEVMADGNHMGRVLDNVLSNICKYAQEGTRVYMDIFEKDGKAYVVFKNISSQELNISPDELMERFVRGDESRNSEGSGLGLNIAGSLMRLQGGDFNISIDGDLFKTEISMPIA